MSSPGPSVKRKLEASNGDSREGSNHLNKRVKSDTDHIDEVEPEFLLVHKVECTQNTNHNHHARTAYFLDPPRLFADDNKASALRGTIPIFEIEEHLEDNEHISIVVYKSYDCEAYHQHLTNKDVFERIKLSSSGVRGVPALQPYLFTLKEDAAPASCKSEEMTILSSELKDALKHLKKLDSRINIYTRDFWHLEAPYLHLYHFRGLIKDNVLKLSSNLQQQHVNILLKYIDEAFGEDYADADTLFTKGLVSEKHLSKLFGPDEIVVTIKDGQLLAYVSAGLPQASRSSLELSCMSWGFDGSFHRKAMAFRVDWPPFGLKVLPISELEMFPLRYDTSGAEEMLRDRGKRLWSCRKRRYMSYNVPEDTNSIQTVYPRYMIDMDMYRRMNSDESESPPKKGDLEPEVMESDEAPEGSFTLLLPATIKGYGLQDKKWRDLNIEHIHEIAWNVEAFDRLVLKATKKELVKALVTVHVATSASTDVIEGKGNGLITLLRGGPGTGKTLTAESVAELTAKPLYRVTCGDIGTNPEDVEKYLESVLLVGRIWGCVVLLDEADVFLEERSQTDLQRNALVSVFLRVLEYYDGILILTTNCVGIFDEAFKSRIQLAIHYPALDQDGRWEIWSNFINSLDREKAKVDDLRKRVDLLSRSKLNGRQIRNTVKTAMQLAHFRGETLDYMHFQRVLEVADEFEKYIDDAHGGYTDDEFAKSQNLRA